jgi:predicted nuclease with TOPRIM domain
MNSNNDSVNQRLAELEAENARLRATLEMIKAERKELRERMYGPYSDEATRAKEEQDLIEFMKNRVPGEGMRFFADLGLLPGQNP